MRGVGCAATLGPTYAIKSFLRCQSQATARCCQHIKLLCLTAEKLFAANHFARKLRAAIILMSFKSFSVRRRNRKTNLGGWGVEMGSLCRLGSFFFFFVMQIYLESFFVWLKETNLQIDRLSRLTAGRSDRRRAGLGDVTPAVLHMVQVVEVMEDVAAAPLGFGALLMDTCSSLRENE